MPAPKKQSRNPLARLQHTRPVVVPLVGASVMSVVIALLWKDLGLNLMADAIALWFGLFVVEAAIEKGRAEARRPAHRALIHDLVRVRQPITHLLSLLVGEVVNSDDLPALRVAIKREGDVAAMLARRRLTTSPAPMRQLGILSGPQLTWWQIINSALTPQALRLEVLIARYVTVADAPTLAALQELEVCLFMDVLRGRTAFDDDLILEVFWRSLIQSLDALDRELERALADHDDIDALLGPGAYLGFAIDQIARKGIT